MTHCQFVRECDDLTLQKKSRLDIDAGWHAHNRIQPVANPPSSMLISKVPQSLESML